MVLLPLCGIPIAAVYGASVFLVKPHVHVTEHLDDETARLEVVWEACKVEDGAGLAPAAFVCWVNKVLGLDSEGFGFSFCCWLCNLQRGLVRVIPRCGTECFVRRIWANKISFFVRRPRDVAHPGSGLAQACSVLLT